MLRGSLVERAHEAQIRSYYVAGTTLLVTLVLGIVNILLIMSSHSTPQVVSPTQSHRASVVANVANLIPWTAVVGLLIAAALYLSGAIMLSRARASRPLAPVPAESAAPAPAVGVEDGNSPSRRLMRQAVRDAELISWYIHYLPDTAEMDLHMDAHTPYIDLTFGFVNASLFDLRFDHAEGLVRYRDEPLQYTLIDPAQAVSATTMAQRDILHGRRGTFVLRQWFSSDAARVLADDIRKGPAIVDVSAVAICFAYTDTYTGEVNQVKQVRVGIPGHPFVIARA